MIDPGRSWGWRIVNYEKYRKIRSEDERREYQRQFMAKKRAREKQEKLAPVSNVSPCSKQYAVSSKQETPTRSKAAPVSGGSLPIAEEFERFWILYPRKKGKVEAGKAWRTIKPEEAEAVLARVELNKFGEWKGSEPRFIPYPATWLNGRRWEDEIEHPQKTIADTDELRRKRTQITPEGQAIRERLGQRAEVVL